MKHLFHVGRFWAIFLVFLSLGTRLSSQVMAGSREAPAASIRIEPVASADRGGKGFRMVYAVQAPLSDFWRFKTDFANPVMLSNKYILENSVMRREADRVITATRYTHHPEALFEWETTVQADRRQMNYRLLNPIQCGQVFQFGRIQLQPLGDATQVTHTAYFDFAGVFWWYYWPFQGGMQDYLRYTVDWERAAFQRWQADRRPAAGGPAR
jgi:hypothetical protein